MTKSRRFRERKTESNRDGSAGPSLMFSEKVLTRAVVVTIEGIHCS